MVRFAEHVLPRVPRMRKTRERDVRGHKARVHVDLVVTELGESAGGNHVRREKEEVLGGMLETAKLLIYAPARSDTKGCITRIWGAGVVFMFVERSDVAGLSIALWARIQGCP